jgi:predicted NAD/FAD-binding protein
MKVAIVGSGIAGLAAAHTLAGQADITLFEAGSWFGGHTHTVDITLRTPLGPVTHGVDTGFLVFNERTYPRLIELFAGLGVATVKSDMSFSVQVPGVFRGKPLEWSGSSLNTVFAQRANLCRPRFLRMLRDLLRFNRLATRIAESGEEAGMRQPLAEFLREHRFSDEFRDWYLLPMIGCIWSCPTDQMLRFPVATLVRFCHNHGLLQVTGRPQWWTVAGGARNYVDKIVARIPDRRLSTPVRRVTRNASGAAVSTDTGTERFDHVVMATHPDQALDVLADASAQELEVLGAIRYQRNRAVLHTDTSVLPRQRSAWAAWNYESAGAGRDAQVCLHYWLNRLQPLPWDQPVLVSLNPMREIPRTQIMGEYDYDHPVFDRGAIAAQALVAQLQGQRRTWFCGAWTGYGFHEDGLKAGQRVGGTLLNYAQAGRAAPAALMQEELA